MSKISKLTDQILIEFEKKHGECEELAYELYEARKEIKQLKESIAKEWRRADDTDEKKQDLSLCSVGIDSNLIIKTK